MRRDWGMAGTTTATWSSLSSPSIPSTSGPMPPRQVVSMRLLNWIAPAATRLAVSRATAARATAAGSGRESEFRITASWSGSSPATASVSKMTAVSMPTRASRAPTVVAP